MNPIPLVDISPQWEELRTQILLKIQDVLDQREYILGKQVSSLERQIADICGRRHGIGVANGTDALILALHAFGIGPGDEVITTPFSFFATAGSIIRVGATPVFADVNPRTFNLDPVEVEKRITPRTKAIIPVHVFGLMADMPLIRKLADDNGLKVIEDACQAIGAEREGNKIGYWADATALSFYPTKNLGGCGDGGMILLSDDDIAERIRRLRVHGSDQRYIHKEVGWNSRLDEVQAAILNVKLTYLEKWTEERRARALRYNAAFENLPFDCPFSPDSTRHVYHLYTILTERRDELRQALKVEGISSDVYYPIPLHLQEALRNLGYQLGDMPVAEYLSDHCLSLPLYPGMRTGDQERVIEQVTHFFNGK